MMARFENFGLPVFAVNDARFARAKAAIEQLSRVAQRIDPAYRIDIIYPGQDEKPVGKDKAMRFNYMALNSSVPASKDWLIVAKLHWDEVRGENIFTITPTIQYNLDDAYAHNGPACDKCERKHRRNTTYIIQSKRDGRYLQIGSDCFIGFDTGAAEAVLYAELLWEARQRLEVEDAASAYEYTEAKAHEMPVAQPLAPFRNVWIDTLQFVAIAVNHLSSHVFVSRKKSLDKDVPATADKVLEIYDAGLMVPSTFDYQRAEEVLEWIRALQVDDNYPDAFMLQLQTICRGGMFNAAHVGYVVGLREAYDREVRAARLDYVGTVGEWLEFDKMQCERSIPVTAKYGNTLHANHYMFGDGVVVFFSRYPAIVGTNYTGRMRVKEHKEFNGMRQTVCAWDVGESWLEAI